MLCPWCEKEAEKTKVVDSNVKDKYTLRKRFCVTCGRDFHTHEVTTRTPANVAWPFSDRLSIALLTEKGYSDKDVGKMLERPYTMVRIARESMLDSGEYFDMLDIIEQEKD